MLTDIPPLTEAHKYLLRCYGNHTRTCARQMWLQRIGDTRVLAGPEPDCNCGWLAVLEAAV